MKNTLKRLLETLRIKKEIIFFYLKLKELYFKVFRSTNSAKEKYIQKQLKKSVGYDIDFSKQPETFNEKIQFRKIYDNNILYSICSDKYRVREYVKEKIGEEYLIPLLLVTDELTEEQWNKLPNQFVAKANHNSGPVQIVKDKSKVNKREIIKELKYQLKLDYGILSMEKYYSDIPRKIIVEKFLNDTSEKELKDYKFFCFDGKIKYCQLIKNRSTDETIDFYDINWIKQDFTGLSVQKISPTFEKKPINYEKMLEIVKKLAEGFDFVRVDLYNIDGKIYFGELTFCPASGYGKFIPEKWNYIISEFWKQKKLK